MAKGTTSSARKKNRNTRKTRSGSNVWLAFAVAAALAGAIGVFVLLSQVTSTTTYYVLNQDVDARSEITAEMLTEVTTSTGGQPRNALDVSAFTTEVPVYARYHLSTGDIVTPSNVGIYSPIQEGIPEEHVVASFAIPAENAVAGKVKRGDYIDIISVGDDLEGENTFAQYVLRHVLVLDTAADLGAEQLSSEGVDAAEDTGVRSGVPTIYTVSLPQEDAAKLAVIQNLPMAVVLSPIEYETEGVPSESTYVNPSDVFGPDTFVNDSGAGTDPTFGQQTEEEAEEAEENEGEEQETASPDAPDAEETGEPEDNETGEPEDNETDEG